SACDQASVNTNDDKVRRGGEELGMQVLVTGGAGYIGSVVVEELLRDGHEVIVYDNISKGHESSVSPGALFVRGDLRDALLLSRTFAENRVDAVVHMAA